MNNQNRLNEYSEQGICRICSDETNCVRIDDDLFCKYCLPELYRVAMEAVEEDRATIARLEAKIKELEEN